MISEDVLKLKIGQVIKTKGCMGVVTGVDGDKTYRRYKKDGSLYKRNEFINLADVSIRYENELEYRNKKNSFSL
jgi:hypothetical protein